MFHWWRYIPSHADSHNRGINLNWIYKCNVNFATNIKWHYWFTSFIVLNEGIDSNWDNWYLTVLGSITIIDNICIQVAVYIICPLLVLTVFGTVNYCKVVNPHIGLKLVCLQQKVNNVSVKVLNVHMLQYLNNSLSQVSLTSRLLPSHQVTNLLSNR